MGTNHLFDNIESYLRQQQELTGNTVFLDERITAEARKEEKIKTQTKSTIGRKDDFSFKPDILASPSDLFIEEPDWKKSKSMDELYEKIHDCLNCPLGSTRTKFVFGSGNPNADIMVIGEAPGADEDAQGLPFVGRAGQLLTKILESINLSRNEVYIGNIIKCRPPGNRQPQITEVEQCEPYLMKQIELIKPAFILAVGLTAVDTLLKGKHKMGDIRGSLMNYHGIKMLVTYHPAALLRNPDLKKFVWEDVKLLRRLYDEYLNEKSEN